MDELDQLFAESYARARRGRENATLIFAATCALFILVVFLFVTAPNGMGGGGEPEPGVVMLLGLGAAGLPIGLVWMWRILRADPEADTPAWRRY
jgi:hypothetical protein